jgi:hypothetical protein
MYSSSALSVSTRCLLFFTEEGFVPLLHLAGCVGTSPGLGLRAGLFALVDVNTKKENDSVGLASCVDDVVVVAILSRATRRDAVQCDAMQRKCHQRHRVRVLKTKQRNPTPLP